MSRSLFLFLSGTALSLCSSGYAQRQLMILADETPHVVTRASGSDYHFRVQDKMRSQTVRQSRTALIRAPGYYPGFIHLENFTASSVNYREYTAETGGTHKLEYHAQVRPNRDILNAYLIIHWQKTPTEFRTIVCPIGSLKKGVSRSLRYSLDVPRSYAGTSYEALFMANGFQVMASAADVTIPTPFMRYLEQTPEEERRDGGPEVLRHKAPATVFDENKQPLAGTVLLQVEVDADGFVRKAEVAEASDRRLIEPCINSIGFWEFKPAIRNGKPYKTSIKVPFAFKDDVL